MINWDNCQESKFVRRVHFIICETQELGPGPRIIQDHRTTPEGSLKKHFFVTNVERFTN